VAGLAVLVGGSLLVPGSPIRAFTGKVIDAECVTWFGHAGGPRLAAYGDSITKADGRPDLGLLGTESWYSHLVCPGDFADGGNAGVAGETSAQVLARLRADRPEVDVLVITAGTNDLRPGVPTEETVRNLTDAVETGRDCAATVLLATPIAWRGTDGAELDAAVRELAARERVPLVDFAGVLSRDGMTKDGVHPTAAAARRLAGLVRAALFPREH
jgi:lysophospholipase L1-like esterase